MAPIPVTKVSTEAFEPMSLPMVRQIAARDPLPGREQTTGSGRPEALVESYRRLAEVFHHVLSEQSLDTLLERIADTLGDLMPYEALHVYEADVERACSSPFSPAATTRTRS